ncbi:MAG: flagellar biosynthesis protein FlhB [Melioribacteraceae bacterium]|nr:flagellar biosynthesis protein FlhB [Melioribacteraceae bacterium]
MAEVDGQEKTEQPTPKKLTDARRKGQVAKSMEINSLAVFGSGLIMIYLTKGYFGDKFFALANDTFSQLNTLKINSNMVQEYFIKWTLFFFMITAPVLLAILVFSFISNVAQIGFKFSPEVFQPKLSKFNFIKNAKNLLFSTRSFVETLKSLAKLAVISIFTYYILSDLIEKSMELVQLTIEDTVTFMMDSAISLIWKIVLLFGVIASADMIFQRFKFKKDMMMTKEEVKEEIKQTEGDPIIKQRIRKEMYKISSKRMMKDVPKADVIITNPTHFAVALKYDMTKDGAPKVIAKGMDELAQRIKKIAKENNVPLHEDVQLARALYKACDIGDEIPAKLFKAVAQILAYIYQMKRIRKRKSIV